MNERPQIPRHLLEDIVAPYDLCRQIPMGFFDNSALVWKTHQRGLPLSEPCVFERDAWEYEMRADAEQPIIPAPTAGEILELLRGPGRYASAEFNNNGPWEALFCTDKMTSLKCDGYAGMGGTPAAAAMHLWLRLPAEYRGKGE